MKLKQQVTKNSGGGQCGGWLPKIHQVSTLLLLSFYAISFLASPASLAQQSDSETRGPLTLFAAIDTDEEARSTNNRRELPGVGGGDEAPEFSLMGSTGYLSCFTGQPWHLRTLRSNCLGNCLNASCRGRIKN